MKHLIKRQEKMEETLSDQSLVHYRNVVSSLDRSGAEEEDPCVIYVSKMIAVEATWLPRFTFTLSNSTIHALTS